jgi:hypothetical protein
MSGMPYPDFLNAIIDDGENEVRERFLRPNQKIRLEGALEGFDVCRGKGPEDIAALLDEARERRQRASRDRARDYWFWREREAQIEHVLGVISALLYSNGLPTFGDVFTRHLRKAADILA